MKRMRPGETQKQEFSKRCRQPVALSRQDVAQALGLSLRSVDYAIARGDIMAKRYGKRVLVPTAEIGRYLEKLEPIVPRESEG
jgi:excisionase family DNA binding protein